MTSPRRGEVWLVDLGMAAKVRPALVISIPVKTSIVLLSRSFRTPRVHASPDSRRPCPSRSCAQACSMRRIWSPFRTLNSFPSLGRFNSAQLASVERAVCVWLGLPTPSSEA
jgi:mRNA interferase MazF